MANGKQNYAAAGQSGTRNSDGGNSNRETSVALARQTWVVGFHDALPPTDTQLRAYKQAVRISPRRAWYRSRLAKAFWALGMVQEALEHFEKACELMPYEPFYRLELAEAYLTLNRLDEAIDQLQQVIAWAPYDDYYHVRLAAAYLRAERLDDAIATMEKAIKLRPRNASYHCLLGLLYLLTGQKERAMSHLRFRWQLDQYDWSFLRRFQQLCGQALDINLQH